MFDILDMPVLTGVNGFSGVLLKAIFAPTVTVDVDGTVRDITGDGTITKSNTYGVTVWLQDDNGLALPDYDKGIVLLSFSQVKDCSVPVVPALEIGCSDPVAGEFTGIITDDYSADLPEGKIYVSLAAINNFGAKTILDMCQTKVEYCVNPKRAL